MSVVFALATPPAKSAICVFRVSGPGCHKGLKLLTKKKSFEHGRFFLSSIFDKDALIDRAGLVVFVGPNSYTGEDSFEVYAHGGLGVMASVVRAFKGVGFDEAAPGEFTKRAFLNNKITLNEAESIADLIDATDERGVVLSNSSLFGDMSKDVIGFAEKIDDIRVKVEAEIDFTDEGNEYMDASVVPELERLVGVFGLFVGGCVNKKIVAQKNNILLVGPVNSGKSSVFNRLLGFERAIVSDIPGTTRDLIGSEIFYESSSFSIFDSAGIRETRNKVERTGIDLSFAEVKKADLVVGVFEVFDGVFVNKLKSLCEGGAFISIQNKTDIFDVDNENFDCCVSAKTGSGFDVLKSLIVSSFDKGAKNDDYKYLVRERHEVLFKDVLKCLGEALKGLKGFESLELVAEELKNARSGLDEVVGRKYSDSLLGDIFSGYCIGK